MAESDWQNEAEAAVFLVPDEADHWRLDRALGLVLPELGLRARRRLIESGRVLVHDRPRPAAYRVRAGDCLEIVRSAPPAEVSPAEVQVLFDGPDFAAVAKPAGLHSAAVAGSGQPNLEALLPGLFPGRQALLLSRLDRLTSGIVPVAFSAEAAERYRRCEDEGAVTKTYLAVVHGQITAPLVIVRELDTDDRAKTRVLRCDASDRLRRTEVRPEAEAQGLTLVRCRIAKGARHQIRAHLAASGHPLVGDPLYGVGEVGGLFLHCAALACPVLDVQCEAPWRLADALRAVAIDRTREKGEGAMDEA